MRRGTTPEYTFDIGLDTSFLKVVRVLYSQNDNVVFVKTIEDCTLDGTTISVRLTQEDTFSLDSDLPVQIQIRVLTKGGQAHQTDVHTEDVAVCLDDEVMV